MRKLVVLGVVLATSAHLGLAQGFFVGGHGAYTVGGDVEESDVGFGVQGGMDMSETLSLELAWTRFSDEASEGPVKLSADADVFSGTARYKFLLADQLTPYVGAGLDYLMISASASISITPEQRSELEGLANAYGISVNDVLLASGLSERSVDVDLDNTIGYHVCAGMTFDATESFQVFGEYRYTFGSIEGEGIDEDYTYGLLRVGANVLL